MQLTNAVDAIAITDPYFASDRGVELVRSVLDQARNEPLSPDASIEPTAEERKRLELRHRIGPLVGRRFPTPESVEMERDLMTVQLQLSILAREVCGALSGEGIESRILKGLATSELDYAKPSLRHTGDVDLLVNRGDLERATEVLLASGLRAADEVAAAEGRLTDGHNLKGVVFEHHTGIEVDLHYRLSRFAPPSDEIMRHSTDLLFGLSALSTEGRLVHAAAHAVLSPNPGRRLSSVADIVAILDNTVADSGEFDWGQARALADELGLTAGAGVALRAEALLMGRDPHPGQEWPRPGRLLQSMTETTKRLPVVEHALALAALPPGMTKRSYLEHRLTPSSHLVDKRGGRLAYYRNLARRGRAL
jgi:hypothetical protein